MTKIEAIAEAVNEFAGFVGQEAKTAETPAEYEQLVELTSIMKRIARCLRHMTFDAAKATILDFDEPERTIIFDLLAKRGLFL